MNQIVVNNNLRGALSCKAAKRGKKFFPFFVLAAKICVYPSNDFELIMECDKSSAVTFFDIFLFCKIMIFDTPLIEDASAPTVDCRSYPATKMSTSPPIFVAAVTVARIPEETMKKYRVTTWER